MKIEHIQPKNYISDREQNLANWCIENKVDPAKERVHQTNVLKIKRIQPTNVISNRKPNLSN